MDLQTETPSKLQQKCLVSNENEECAPKQPPSTSKFMANCVRRNNKVCYSDYQHLVIADEIPTTRSGPDLLEDSIYSGESLYKNLEFDQCQNEAENEKCLAFWKSVMEKNLEPIKCTLLKPSIDNKVSHESTEGRIFKQTRKKKGIPKSPSAQKYLESIPQSTDDEVTSKKDDIFMRIFNEIKKKKLDKLTQIVKQNCKTCELLDSMNKDVIYSGDQDLEGDHLDHMKAKNGEPIPESMTSFVSDRQDKQKSKDKGTKKTSSKQSKSSTILGGIQQSISKSIQNVTAKIDVETNTSQQHTKNPTCSCQTDLCVCKHDLAAVLKKMGKGPCSCGFAQCICRKNLYLSNDSTGTVLKSPGSPQADGKLECDGNLDEVDKLGSTEPKSETSSPRAELLPSNDTEKKPTVSDKNLLPTKEYSDNTSARASSIIKFSTGRDNASKKTCSSLSKDPLSPKTDSQSRISFHALPSKTQSIDEIKSGCTGDQLRSESGQVKSKPKQGASQQHHQSFSTPLTNIITEMDGILKAENKCDFISDHSEHKQVMQTNNLQRDRSSTKGSRNSTEVKCECDYNDCDCKNIIQDNSKRDMSSEKSSLSEGQYACSLLSGLVKGTCECGFSDCDCEKMIKYEESETKCEKKKRSSCICGCGHSLCRCKASESIRDLIKKLEDEHSSSKLKPCCKTSVTTKEDNSKCNICSRRSSKISKQSSKAKEISDMQQSVCECTFADCDCNELRSIAMENASKLRLDRIAQLDKKVVEAELDYFAKTPVVNRFISTGVQCEHINPEKMRERKYCLVCGHYDCPCEVDLLTSQTSMITGVMRKTLE